MLHLPFKRKSNTVVLPPLPLLLFRYRFRLLPLRRVGALSLDFVAPGAIPNLASPPSAACAYLGDSVKGASCKQEECLSLIIVRT